MFSKFDFGVFRNIDNGTATNYAILMEFTHNNNMTRNILRGAIPDPASVVPLFLF